MILNRNVCVNAYAFAIELNAIERLFIVTSSSHANCNTKSVYSIDFFRCRNYVFYLISNRYWFNCICTPKCTYLFPFFLSFSFVEFTSFENKTKKKQFDFSCSNISDIGVGYISTMLSLTALFLRWCSQVRDFGLQHLCSMRNLQILSLAGKYFQVASDHFMFIAVVYACLDVSVFVRAYAKMQSEKKTTRNMFAVYVICLTIKLSRGKRRERPSSSQPH